MTDSPKSGDSPAEGLAANTPSPAPDSDGDKRPADAVRVQRHVEWRERASQLLPARLRRQHLIVVVSLAVTLSAVGFSALQDAPVEPAPTDVAAERPPSTEPAPTTAALAPSPSSSPSPSESASASPSRSPAGGAASNAPAPSSAPTRTVSASSSPARPSTGSTQKCSTVQEVKLCSRIVGSGPFKLETSIYSPGALTGTWVYSTGVEGDGGEPTDELVHLGDLRAGKSSWTTDCGNFTSMWSSFIGHNVTIETEAVTCP